LFGHETAQRTRNGEAFDGAKLELHRDEFLLAFDPVSLLSEDRDVICHGFYLFHHEMAIER
jgi:hypothetical protein